MLEKLLEPCPVLTSALTPPVEPLENDPSGFMCVGLQTLGIPEHSVVIVVAPELGIQYTEVPLERKVTMRPAPLGERGQGIAKLLPGGTPNDHISSPSIDSPAEFEAQKLKARLLPLAKSREA